MWMCHVTHLSDITSHTMSHTHQWHDPCELCHTCTNCTESSRAQAQCGCVMLHMWTPSCHTLHHTRMNELTRVIRSTYILVIRVLLERRQNVSCHTFEWHHIAHHITHERRESYHIHTGCKGLYWSAGTMWISNVTRVDGSFHNHITYIWMSHVTQHMNESCRTWHE